MRVLLILVFCFSLGSYSLSAQVNDDFSDGNLDSNPTWAGDLDDFIINPEEELQLDAIAQSDTSILVTALELNTAEQIVWEFRFALDFNPSNVNNLRYYLMSDQANLRNDLNGYFLRIGENGAEDAITIYRQEGSSESADEIFTGSANIFPTAPEGRIRIVREGNGTWNVSSDANGEMDFISEGSFSDNALTSMSYSGYFLKYTSGNSGAFRFDDVLIQGEIIIDEEAPELIQINVLSANQLELSFNEVLDQGSAENSSNYEVPGVGSPVSASLDGEDPSLVLLQFGSSFPGNEEQTLNLSGIEDLNGNAMPPTSENFTFEVDDIAPELIQINVLSANQLELSFNETLDQGSAENSSNYEVPGLGSPVSASLDGEDPSLVLLQFGSSFPGNEEQTLNLSGIEDLNGNAMPPTSENFTFEVDDIAPELTQINVLSANQLELSFNEALDENSAETNTHYEVPGIGNPISAILDEEDADIVLLEFGSPFPENQEQTLNLSSIEDLNGNVSAPISENFIYVVGVDAVFRSVVINEIFADPTPTFGLPETEFVELHNPTEDFFDLSNWVFVNTTTEKILPSFVFDPGAYLILCDVDDVEAFEDFGDVIGISSFTALVNGGDSLSLRSNTDEVIDIVSYSSDWYNDSEKEDGGWTLEQINPITECTGANNWTASNSALGGTPGTENSIYDTSPDLQVPEYIGYSLIDQSSFEIVFSETLNEAASTEAVISIGGGLNILSVDMGSSGDRLRCEVDGTIETGVFYPFSVNAVPDCSGNTSTLAEDEIIIGFVPLPGEVIINEFMADPSPANNLPEAEYVEFFNTSEKVIDLGNCTFSGAEFPEQTLIAPQEYLVGLSAENQQDQPFYSSATPMESWSSTFLTNSGRILELINGDGLVIDWLEYDIEWYQDPEKDDGGWSLELINPEDPCSDQSNWKASVDDFGGTPGLANSVLDLSADEDAPELLNAFVPGPQFVQLNFSEPINADSLENAEISINGGAMIVSIEGLDDPLSSLLLTLDPAMEPGIIYTVSIDGVFDCWGNPSSGGLEGKVAVPEAAIAGDLVVNEILSNPYDDGEDFIEIYNRSEKNISLFGWKLANEDDGEFSSERMITEFDFLLFPGEYLVLSSSIDQVTEFYPGAREDRFLRMESLPSYSNSEGVVYLLDALGEVMDRVPYFEDQHYPLLNDLNGVSLERLDFDRASDDFGNWHSAAESVNFATPGYLNSQFVVAAPSTSEVSISPEVFSPDNDGYQDVTLISYSLELPGYTGTITVYDDLGRKVRVLARNQLLGIEGSFTWDGFDDDNQKAGVGIYIIVAELFDPDGNTELLKIPCVLAHRLN